MTIERAAVVGLGKLGLPLAACFAAKGIDVVGVDLNGELVAAVNEERVDSTEPGLAEMLTRSSGRLRATSDVADAVANSDATFIVVPTPSVADGGFSLDDVLAACRPIGRALADLEGHVVIVTSTVLPGATWGEIRAVLEGASGKKAGRDFGLCYSPEFIALGSVIADFLEPDFVLIGESDSDSGSALAGVYARVCENEPPVARMNPTNAEITKLAVNTFVTTKISYANMLAELCERVDDGDVDVVTAALGLDARIGSNYLKGGLGYGGPCFPRDNVALATFARSVGVEPLIPEATDAANRVHARHVLDVVRSNTKSGETVGVLGLSYKPDTDVTERSAGMELASGLAAEGLEVVAFDPAVPERSLPAGVAFADSLEGCLSSADVVVVATPWPVFREGLEDALHGAARPRLVVDCWRILDPGALDSRITYVGLGSG